MSNVRWKTLRISEDNLDYLKSMQADSEAADQVRYSLDDMISYLIDEREGA